MGLVTSVPCRTTCLYRDRYEKINHGRWVIHKLSESELGATNGLYQSLLSSFYSFLCCNKNTLRVYNLLYLF